MANFRITQTLARLAAAGIAVAFLTAAMPAPGDASPQIPSPTQRLPKPRAPRKPPKPSDSSPAPDRTEPKTEAEKPKTDSPDAKAAAAPAGTPVRTPPIWLDAPLKNWNVAGAPLPAASKGREEPGMDDRCKDTLRAGNSPEDALVTGAGWLLFGPRQTFDDVTLVSATVGADGMCRPMGHQTFIFVHGTFAGTIAPQPMASRFDGDADRLFLYSASTMSAEFRRYSERDPLCCPSGRASVTYAIDRKGPAPLLVPTNITPDVK